MNMIKTAAGLGVAALLSGGTAFAQDGGRQEQIAPAQDVTDSISIRDELEAPDYFERSGRPGDNLGDHIATRNIDLDNYWIINLAYPENPGDAATKEYVDDVAADSGSGGGGGGGDNLGDHVADEDLDMSGFKLLNMNHLDMGWHNILRANLVGSRMYSGSIEDTVFRNGEIYTSDAVDITIDQSDITYSFIDESRLDYPEIHFMEAWDHTVFNGFTVWNNDIWMQGNLIKEAKIGISLDINDMPLINVPDPGDPQDAANKRWVLNEISKVSGGGGDVTALESRVDTVESDLGAHKTADDTRHAALESRVASLEASGSGGNGGETSALEGRVDTLETKTTGLDGDVTSLKGRVATLESSGSGSGSGGDTGAQISALQSDVSTLQTEVSDTQGGLDGLRGWVEYLDGQVSTKSGEIDTLKTRVSALETNIGAIYGELDAVDARITTEVNAINGRLNAIENRLDAIENP